MLGNVTVDLEVIGAVDGNERESLAGAFEPEDIGAVDGNEGVSIDGASEPEGAVDGNELKVLMVFFLLREDSSNLLFSS